MGLVKGFRALGVRMVQLCYNLRNLTDDLIRAIAGNGGLIGAALTDGAMP